MNDIESAAYAANLRRAGEPVAPFGHYFRDAAGGQHFHTGAIVPPFAQSEIVPLYTTPPASEEVGALREKVLAAVPTSWLDPLLSGPEASELPLNGLALERLLLRVRDRLGEAFDAALALTNPKES